MAGNVMYKPSPLIRLLRFRKGLIMTEPTLSEVLTKVTECQKDVNRMIIGFYGDLTEPGSGFAAETKTNIADIKSTVDVILGDKIEKKKDNQWSMQTMITGAVAVFAFVKSFFFSGN